MKTKTKVRARPRQKRRPMLRFSDKWLKPCGVLKSVRNRTRDLEYAVAAGDAAAVYVLAKDIRWLLEPFVSVKTADLAR